MRRTVLVGALFVAALPGGGCGGRSIRYDETSGANGFAALGGVGGSAANGARAGTSALGSGVGGSNNLSGETAGVVGAGGAPNGTGAQTNRGGRGTGTSAGRGSVLIGGGTGRGGRNAGAASGAAGKASDGAGSEAIATGGDAGASEAGAFGDAGAAGSPGAGDIGNIVQTDLVVDLDALHATATITLAASSATTASFEVGDLTIKSVTAANGPVNVSTATGKLYVEYQPSTDPVVITVDYQFQIHNRFDGAATAGFTFTWPYYCGNLFPCHSDPSDGTRFSLVINSSNDVVYPSVIDFEAPSYMLAWSSGAYATLDLGMTTAGTHIVARYLTDNPMERPQMTIGSAHVRDAFDWLEQHYGPYVFGSEAGPVSVPWPDTFGYDGMEHHPFWHIREDDLTDELTQIHEAVHGWFGNGVRLRCWEDFVLAEGTVSYLAARLLQTIGSESQGEAIWQEYENTLSSYQTDDPIVAWPSGCNRIDVQTSQLDAPSTYVKGALFMRALEQRVGTDQLDAALASFYAKWVGKAAGEQDLLDAVQASTGYDPSACAEHFLKELGPSDEPCP